MRRCSDGTRLQKRVSDLLHTEIITRGDLALTQEPVTITSFVAERSAGGVHDFYSEGDYWWPDPVNPDSAYIRRDRGNESGELCCSSPCNDPFQFDCRRLDFCLDRDER